MKKVNTFIIGVQKAGTTSLYEWLIQHPEVYGESFLKEFPFFIEEKLYSQGYESFEEKFRPKQDEKIIITGCVDYIEDKESLKRIKKYNPEAKIILLLRNPEKRINSAFTFLRQLSEEENSDVNEAIKKRPEYLERSLYGEKLEFLYSIFPKENIKVILFEAMTKNPKMLISDVFRFLKVSHYSNIDYYNANKTGVVKFGRLNKLIFDKKSDNIFRRLARKMFSPNFRIKIRRWIKNLNTKKNTQDTTPVLDPSLKMIIYEDRDKVQNFINVEEYW